MFVVSSNGPDRLDIEFGGKLDADAMRVGLDELIEKSRDIEHGRMLYQVDDFDMPTFGALGVELSRLPQLFGLISKFDRIAVLAEKEWVHRVSEVKGGLLPGVEIRAFDLDERGEAEVWLAS